MSEAINKPAYVSDTYEVTGVVNYRIFAIIYTNFSLIW